MEPKNLLPNVWVLPAVAYVTALTIFPTVYLAYVSALQWDLYGGPPTFIGFRNYVSALTDPIFLTSVLLTMGYAAFVTIIEIVLGLGIALTLNMAVVLYRIVRNSLILPLMMTPFLVYMNWRFLFGPGQGPIAYFWQVFFHDPNPLFFSRSPAVYFSFLTIE